MSFNFQEFISKSRDDKQKKEVVEKYQNYFGDIKGDIQDQIWYKNYVSKFNERKPQPYIVPENLKNDFDWDMLCVLVAASFSSEGSYVFQARKETPHLLINVKSGDQNVKRKAAILKDFQIRRLFEIYIEEQMNLAILIAEDDEKIDDEEDKNEKKAILAQRKWRLEQWKRQHESIPIKKKVNEFENKILDYLDTP